MKKERIVILGGGESGTGSAVLAVQKDYDVFLSDRGAIKPEYREILNKHQIEFEENQHTVYKILQADLVVKSPGIPDDVPLILQLKDRSIPVISEIEFAARYTNARLVAITGTNGKTTTTLLTYHILKSAGLNVGLAGNVGKSFALQVAESDHELFVLEVSSFQLDGVYETRFDVGVLLNIAPDHLDRYQNDMQNYIASKFRLVQNMDQASTFIFNADSGPVAEKMKTLQLSANKISVSLHNKSGVYVQNHAMYITAEVKVNLDELPLQGRHNWINMICAAEAAMAAGLMAGDVARGLKTFTNAPHRMEKIAEIGGVSFVNDSKATNVDAVYYALESYDQPVIWIAGGKDKGNDYSALHNLVESKVKAIVALGADNSKIEKAFKGLAEVFSTDNVEKAIDQAYQIAESGEVVLLSPACASFDLFENYEDRGDQFKAAVLKLKKKIDNQLMMVL
ncbi:MAG TPA: UDP-N-acetylmuramoyl-L-alanine--D-glutamate ligase [Cytophagales bacterium]|jgi:UDP-N-acetylmuramoylalanine--D-glutamate ligase|nr:UDP-N-acetylmuramoyl-L-alanine--D-glutamate ligase [Cytophagales bacterium]